MGEREIKEDLATLAWQLRIHAEMDQGFGLRSVPCPSPIAPPRRRAALSAAQPAAPTLAAPRRELKPTPTSLPERAPRHGEKNPVHAAGGPGRSGQSEIRVPGDPRAIEPVPFDEAAEALQARRERGTELLRNLFRELDGCTRCLLHQGRSQIVFGQGDAAAELVFVGEGPGEQEDRQGLAFCGPSGDLLTKMIQAMGLEREDVFIANVVKCRPPENRKPFLDEMKTCLPYLERQLEIIRPRVIIALGKTAAEGLGLLRPEESLTRNRGFHHRYRGIRVMVTFHPAYLLRQVSMKRQAWQDLQQVLPYLKRRQERA